MNKQLAALVQRAVEAGRLPIVLAGSCNAALGVLAGFDHGRCGAVWLDAHADFNTPESTTSGFFAGMSAAVITGHCYRDYWAEIGDNTALAEDAIVMFGVRDLSPEAERQRLQQSAIQRRLARPPGRTRRNERADRFRIRAATLATYTPDRDVDDKTLRAALRILELLGDNASRQGPRGLR